MTNVKLWTFTLFACSMIAAIFETLTPAAQKKQLTYVLQMFFLLCLIAPVSGLANGLPNIDFNTTQLQSIESLDTNAVLNDVFRQQFEQLISNKLEMLGIFPREIGIDFTVSDNAVEVTKVRVILDPQDEQRLAETQSALEQFLGLKVQAEVFQEVK